MHPVRVLDLKKCRWDSVSYLRFGVNTLQWLARQRVPEPNLLIGGPASRRKQAMLVWRPRNGLHRCSVLRKPVHRHVVAVPPHHQPVVVAARSQVVLVRRPTQPAHLLPVPNHLPDVLVGGSDVSLQDAPVPAPRAKAKRVPRQRPDTALSRDVLARHHIGINCAQMSA